jgi:hypothetical protein
MLFKSIAITILCSVAIVVTGAPTSAQADLDLDARSNTTDVYPRLSSRFSEINFSIQNALTVLYWYSPKGIHCPYRGVFCQSHERPGAEGQEPFLFWPGRL